MKKLSLLISAFLIGSLLQAQNLPSYLPANGLVGWWPFNGSAIDGSGNGNNGTVSGAMLTTDRFGNVGKAYSFDGLDDKISIAPNSSLNNFNNSITISAWIYSVGKGNPSYGNQDLQGIFGPATWLVNDGGFLFRLYDNIYDDVNQRVIHYGNGLPTISVFSSQVVQTNSWENITCSYDGSRIRLYRNGIKTDSSNTGGGLTSSLNTTGRFYTIGQCIDWAGSTVVQAFNGKLDDIAIWNRALTQQEITKLYSASSGGGGSNNPYASLSWPQGISYQALARNAQGTPLLNTALQIRFSLLADSINGAVEYAESQNLNSNAQGLINTAFGGGTAITGTWAGINWAKGRKFLKVELNPGGGFVNLGVQELLSVPFSQRSRSAAVLENSNLPVYSGNAAALSGGLLPGQLYRTSAGVLMVVY